MPIMLLHQYSFFFLFFFLLFFANMNDEEMIFTESKLHKRHVYRGDTQKMLDDMFYSHMYV